MNEIYLIISIISIAYNVKNNLDILKLERTNELDLNLTDRRFGYCVLKAYPSHAVYKMDFDCFLQFLMQLNERRKMRCK